MTTDKANWPQWLQEAATVDALVTVADDGRVAWLGGVWRGGVWRGGEWLGGKWHGGEWHGGVWHGGEWRGHENRKLLLAAQLGIVFDETGTATAYRSVNADNSGRWNKAFVQGEGNINVPHDPPDSGVCRAGLHVTSAAIAWSYFGVNPTAKLVRVKFTKDQLLDCDGEKARISGGFCEFIDWPF